MVIIGQYLFLGLIALILLSFAVQIAWFLLGALISGVSYMIFHSGDGKSWTLDNGDTVKESRGFCGEKEYIGSSGTRYDIHDGGRRFTEKD